ncbi:caspase family protein [Micromonospora musae]|uniref:Peptidase C14 caspase domain-containing protein n=1 Tax=Micromonospora musae TaxID=1894970 RepID=A0A3A9Y4S2_9ACTN|nr:caspase family protein [Micromonospora musae]RKN32348.1 hypothetical protein D7044_13945 [Micromonospora musae]
MSEPRFPDPDRSWAVLIGADRFPVAADLPDIPAVRENLSSLQAVLTDPHVGTLPQCLRVDKEATATDVGAALKEAAEAATDVLLVYYAGHGLVDDLGRLYLALAGTDPGRPGYSAVPVELIKRDLAVSSAATRLLILDCCFSGRAIEAMSAPDGLVAGQLAIAGSYTLTSTTANTPAYAPAGETHTAFTGALLRALERPEPLALDQIYDQVDHELAERGLPRPQRRAGNAAGNLALARGGTRRPEPTPAPTDENSFTGQPPYGPVARRSMTTIGIALLLLVPVTSWFSWQRQNWGVLLAFATIELLAGLGAIQEAKNRPRTLTIGRSSLTAERGSRLELRLSWTDIAHLGVMTHHTRKKEFQVLLIRLQPGVPPQTTTGFDPISGRWLRAPYEKLGYIAVIMVGIDPRKVRTAVRWHTTRRLYRTERELFDLDPGLASTTAKLRQWAPSRNPRPND